MSEEEKRAIETTKTIIEFAGDSYIPKENRNALQTLLNLIEKLEDKNKTLERLLQGELYEMYLYYKELAGKYQANCISKDKIREKIKEIDEDELLQKIDFGQISLAIKVLYELLEE